MPLRTGAVKRVRAGQHLVGEHGQACVAHLYRWSSRLLLTKQRVVLRAGIVRQRSSQFLSTTIETVLVEFPVADRLFNYGTRESGLRWESGVYQAYLQPRARARTHPGATIACPPPGSCLKKGCRSLILSRTLSVDLEPVTLIPSKPPPILAAF